MTITLRRPVQGHRTGTITESYVRWDGMRVYMVQLSTRLRVWVHETDLLDPDPYVFRKRMDDNDLFSLARALGIDV